MTHGDVRRNKLFLAVFVSEIDRLVSFMSRVVGVAWETHKSTHRNTQVFRRVVVQRWMNVNVLYYRIHRTYTH